MVSTFKAAEQVTNVMEQLKSQYHLPRLEHANICVAISDSKPFVKNRLNLGSVKKFSDFNKLWQKQQYDFCITLCMDVWEEFLDETQRQALLDLQLTRCEPVYEPEVVIENGKKVVVKDEFGRVKFTENIKLDDDGNPKWQVIPLDLIVITKNIRRFGLWYDALVELEKAVLEKK